MPKPTEIKLHKQSAILDIAFENGVSESLSAEYLRVHSPSAEVRGHSPEQAVLQTDKASVSLDNIESVGAYAVRLIFSDGHGTGLYTWDYLYELAVNKKEYWRIYLEKLKAAGKSRGEVATEVSSSVVNKFNPKTNE